MQLIQTGWYGEDIKHCLSGSTEFWTVSVLQALIRLRRPRRILELGTFEGRTTRAMASVTDAHITTVDHRCRHEGGFPNNVAFQEFDVLTFLRYDGPPFDFVFVDDNHEKDHVAEELDLLMGGIVSEGGLIVLHDVIGPFGLNALVLERGGFIIRLPLLHAAGGLGVIQV